jgi:hypothetical protein
MAESTPVVTRSATGADETPTVGNPWSDGAAAERQRIAERQLGHWRDRARAAEAEVATLRAAQGNGSISFMKAIDYHEVPIMRAKHARWHHDNLAVLTVLSLKPDAETGQPDLRPQLVETPWGKEELAWRLTAHERLCKDHLETHALRAEKFMLKNMALRESDRVLRWQHSIFTHDHSQRNAKGERVSVLEYMAPGSSVRAPDVLPLMRMRALSDAQIRGRDAKVPDMVNVQVSRSCAVVRDVPGELRKLIARVHRAIAARAAVGRRTARSPTLTGSCSPWTAARSWCTRVAWAR